MNQELTFSDLLDRVQMHAADRAAAKATLARAEAIATTAYRATQAVQAAAERIGRAGQLLGQRIRARFA
jgi:Tfp pilus assembly protein FimT